MKKLLTNNCTIGVTALLCAACSSNADEAQRPNILVLMTDDQSYSTIHAMGNDQVITPNFDFLVENGVTFNRNYATTSISMASRACLMSGMYEYHNGCNFMRGAMRPAVFSKSYPLLLRESGYYTAFAGKFGFPVTDEELNGKVSNRNEYLPEDQFDSWGGQGHSIEYQTSKNKHLKRFAKEYPHVTRAIGAYGCEQIKAGAESGKPFCISLYFKAPHGRFTPDPIFEPIYRDTIFRQAPNYGEEYCKSLATQGKLGRQHLDFFGYYHADYQNTVRKINTLVYGVDYVVGELRKQLKACGVDDNTIIIFTSDNGYAAGEKALGGKVLPYEETSRVPLMIYDPRNTSNRGVSTDAVTGNIDITATILDYANVNKPAQMDGVTLRKVVESPKRAAAREWLPLINTWGNPQIISLSIVTDQWKYVYWPYGEKINPAEELFSVDDRYELKNLASDSKYADVMTTMRKYYDEQVEIIKRDCVQEYGYPTMGVIYDRNIPWQEKRSLFTQEQWDLYDGLLSRMGYKGDKYDYNAILERNKADDEARRSAGSVNPHAVDGKSNRGQTLP